MYLVAMYGTLIVLKRYHGEDRGLAGDGICKSTSTCARDSDRGPDAGSPYPYEYAYPYVVRL
eukprot:scaffold216703_cov37-Prasinocladus_malaysianus.AAC.1